MFFCGGVFQVEFYLALLSPSLHSQNCSMFPLAFVAESLQGY